jgi:hypothetical protein
MRFVTSGLAVAAFALTLGIAAWHDPWQHPLDRQLVTVPVPSATRLQAPRSPPSTPAAAPEVASAVEQPEEDPGAPGNPSEPADDIDAAAPQPTPPDPAALPSYEEDQAARNADARSSARSR